MLEEIIPETPILSVGFYPSEGSVLPDGSTVDKIALDVKKCALAFVTSGDWIIPVDYSLVSRNTLVRFLDKDTPVTYFGYVRKRPHAFTRIRASRIMIDGGFTFRNDWQQVLTDVIFEVRPFYPYNLYRVTSRNSVYYFIEV